MRTSQELDLLRQQAVMLRRQGKSRREIKLILGPMSSTTLNEQFLSPVLKRHNPRTARKNVGEDCHGCLRIDVCRSSALYLKIEGWAEAIMDGT